MKKVEELQLLYCLRLSPRLKQFVFLRLPPLAGAHNNFFGALGCESQRAGAMRKETKKQALAKLNAFDVQVGYPKKWRDYTSLVINKTDLFGNTVRGVAFQWEYDRARQRVDRHLDAPCVAHAAAP